MTMSRPHIAEEVASTIARSLACEIADIAPRASLVEGLGMDSLDFLDVIFSLEKSFGIKLLSGEINRMLRPDKARMDKRQDSYLSREEIDRLAPFIPELKTAVEQNRQLLRHDLFKLVSAETLVNIIARELDRKVA